MSAVVSRTIITIVKIATLCIFILLSGCAKFLLGEKALNRNPLEKPTVNVTNFTSSLECMDQLLIDYNAPVITLTAQDIPNMTGGGEIIAGTKDMLITSMSKLSERSQRIRFVSYGTDLRDIILLHKAHNHRDNFITPDFFIRGAITQLDKNVLASRFGGALNDEGWNAAFTSGQGISYAALDLNVGMVSNLQIIPGVTSNNVLALYDKGAGTDLGGRINSVGTFFDFGIDRRDGLGQAIRNMVDLGVIEIVGKLLDMPYMTCLPLDYKNPEVMTMIRKEYAHYNQKPEKLIRSIQAKLKQYNYYHGEVNGIMDRKTALAIEYFRNLYGMKDYSNTGAVDFALYKEILYSPKYTWDFDTVQYQRIATETRLQKALKYDSIRSEDMLSQKYEDLILRQQQNSVPKNSLPIMPDLQRPEDDKLLIPPADARVVQTR